MRLFRFAAPLLLLCFVARVHATEQRPNVVVFYTDDHGYADLSCQGVVDDIRTPHVDRLAKSGVLARHGYSTAPQCVPSRAGLLVGRFQSKFGVESNASSLKRFGEATTIAERLSAAGYVTAQFGKWHLGPGREIPTHGFRHYFNQNAQRPFAANIGLDGQDRDDAELLRPAQYHVDACSAAAANIIRRYHEQPLFLYVAYRAPHVPLDAPQKYLARFPDPMPQRRRQALAMLSAVDDGVGRVLAALDEFGLTQRTLVFYIGDNGAPLKIHKHDAPGGGPGWDGSLNDPLNGEKGMLAEGGMHVPFVVSWPGTIPGGQEYPHPISALDVAATAASIAGLDVTTDQFDGANLVPYLKGEADGPPHASLKWRWVAQSAIRRGDWKLLRGGPREYLYNLKEDLEEQHNLIKAHPEVAAQLRSELREWGRTLTPPGVDAQTMSPTWNQYFDVYLDGKPVPPLAREEKPESAAKGWVARNGSAEVKGGRLLLKSPAQRMRQAPFLVRSGVKQRGPTTLRIVLDSAVNARAKFAWRTSEEKDFDPAHAVDFGITDQSGQVIEVDVPAEGRIVHVRLQIPADKTQLRSVKLGSAELW